MLKQIYISLIVIFALISCSSIVFADFEAEYEINIAKGVSKLNSKDYGDAIELFNAALKASPDDSKAMLMLGISLSRKGRLNEAEDVLKKVLNKQYETARTNYELGVVKYKEGDYASAKEYFGQAERLSGDASLNASIKLFMTDMEGGAKRKRYNLAATLGLQYDSNVPLDSKNEPRQWKHYSDMRTIFYLKGNYAIIESPLRLTAGYSFYQSLHLRLSSLNVQNHNFELKGEYSPVNKVTFEGKYNFDYTYLGSDAYSRMHTLSPSVRLMLIKNMPTKLVYSYSKRGFFDTKKTSDNNDRSGNMNSYGIEQKISLLESLYFTLGYYHEKNNTQEPGDSFRGNKYICSVNYEYAKKLTVKGRFEYYDRDYLGETEWEDPIFTINRKTRHDITRTYGVTATMPISPLLSVSLDQTFINNSSNIYFADYTRSITGIFLTARF